MARLVAVAEVDEAEPPPPEQAARAPVARAPPMNPRREIGRREIGRRCATRVTPMGLDRVRGRRPG